MSVYDSNVAFYNIRSRRLLFKEGPARNSSTLALMVEKIDTGTRCGSKQTS